MKRLALTTALFVALHIFGSLAQANPNLYERMLQSAVIVVTDDGCGSGVVVDLDKKWIVTNYHVVDGSQRVRVHFPLIQGGNVVQEPEAYKESRSWIPGRVLARDSQRDLALIGVESLPKGARALPLSSGSPKPGESVHLVGNGGAVGALFGYMNGAVRAVSQQRYEIGGQQIQARIVVTQLPANPGDSGSPVINNRGELVAIHHSSTSDREGAIEDVRRAIDVTEVRAFLDERRESRSPAAKASPVAERPLTNVDFLRGAFDDEELADEAVELAREVDALMRSGRLEAARPKAIRLFTLLLESSVPDVRRSAAEFLGKLGPAADEAIPALTELLEDEDESVREAAAEALERIDK